MSLKDRLKSRTLPSETYKIAEKDSQLEQAAYAAAKMALRRLESKGTKKSTAAYKAAVKAVDETQAALDACFIELTVRALPANVYDDLQSDHPPTAEQEAKAKEAGEEVAWDEDSFRPALFAACVDGDLTAEDWAEQARNMSKAEVRELWVLCLNLNEFSRNPDLDSVGKGLGAIQSLLSS